MGPAALLAALGIQAKTRAALFGAAVDLQRVWKEVLNVPGTGKVYRRGSVSHVASEAGRPPAPDTGALRRSINVVWVDTDTIRVGTDKDYGRFLEFGTRHISPRPHARPAKDLAIDEMTMNIKSKLGGK